MVIAIPSERQYGEKRVSVLADGVRQLLKEEGVEVLIENNLSDFQSDEDYQEAGAKAVKRDQLFAEADVLMRIHPSTVAEFSQLREGALHISHLDPYNNKDLVLKACESGVSLISMEMIPRSTLAQKMDVLSSQASIAGYQAVLIAAQRCPKLLPMMMTPAGTISPARVFIIGAGVAGLQAIATAKRLGARVEAFDTRAVVEEQVQSLGAKFVKLDLGDTGQTAQGYAKALTEEQLAKQQELMAKHCIQSDIVITTAKLFGRKAPLLIKKEVIEKMNTGAIIVDLAAASGGNVEGTVNDKIVELDGVEIIGIDNLAGESALSASQMYNNNLMNLFKHCWDKESKSFVTTRKEDEILQGCLIAQGKKIVHAGIAAHYQI